MCMVSLNREFPISKEKGEYFGYKVFRVRMGKLRGEFCGRSRVRPTGEWLNADDFASKTGWFPSASEIKKYKPGWHVFRTKKGADSWRDDAVNKVVVKVFVRKIREKGRAFNTALGKDKDCFVCDEMLIPMEV